MLTALLLLVAVQTPALPIISPTRYKRYRTVAHGTPKALEAARVAAERCGLNTSYVFDNGRETPYLSVPSELLDGDARRCLRTWANAHTALKIGWVIP